MSLVIGPSKVCLKSAKYVLVNEELLIKPIWIKTVQKRIPKIKTPHAGMGVDFIKRMVLFKIVLMI